MGCRFRFCTSTHFNPRSPCGERRGAGRRVRRNRLHFNPRSPCGERPDTAIVQEWEEHISIHAPRAGSDTVFTKAQAISGISIHAPRAGSDVGPQLCHALHQHFNPRSPCGERRGARRRIPPCTRYFNPRSPCGERPGNPHQKRIAVDISIHAPRAGSDKARYQIHFIWYTISIHAPRAGSDSTSPRREAPNGAFQSTLPVRGATPPSH